MATNEERIQRVREEAIDRDAAYSGCSQSVLGTLQDEFGIGNKESFKAASVLSGGIASRGETCGAIIGALLALGLVMGRERIEDSEVYKAMLEPSIEVRTRFIEELKKQFGFDEELKNTLCRHIQEKVFGRSFDLSNEEERQAFEDAGGHSETRCPKVCGIAAQLAAGKILELI